MSAPAIDGLIWILLLIAVGFCGISIIGLLLFPDIRSRRHTAVRASIIGCGATVSGVIVFGLFRYLSPADQYLGLIILTLTLFVVIIAGNFFVSRMIMRKVISKNSCNAILVQNPGSDRTDKK